MKHAIALVLALALSSAASAQAPAAPPSCIEPTPADYPRCALWVEQGRLRRGFHAETVTRLGFFSPMKLVANVRGDSAVHYARAYESNLRTAYRWQIAGMVLSLAGFIYLASYECDPDPTFGFCTRSDDDYWLPGGMLIFGGSVANVISMPFTVRGNRFAAKAVFWHNAQFARP